MLYGLLVIPGRRTYRARKTLLNIHILAHVALHQLDRVSPVNNKPSTDKLRHFVRRKKNVTCDM